MYLTINSKNKLFYEDTGSGKPIVFFHGFGGNHVIWTEQVKYLNARGFRTITFDQRGHGKSIGHPANSIRTLIDDSALLINSLNLKDPILVGHSMGSSVIWGINKFHPEIEPKKIVTIDQSPYMLNTKNWDYGFMDLDPNNYIEKINNMPHVKETLNGLDNSVWKELEPFKIDHPFNRKENFDLLKNHIEQDWRDTVLKLNLPYLMVTAKYSPYFRMGYAEILAKENANILIQNVEDTGHDIMAEKPIEFNKIVTSFFNSKIGE